MKIVEKPWGREIWLVYTDNYVFKIIEVIKGNRTSLHYHKTKHEHLYVDRGSAKIEWEQEHGKMLERIIPPGVVIETTPGRKHRIIAIEDVRLFEVSTPEIKDVVRVEDDYQRV